MKERIAPSAVIFGLILGLWVGSYLLMRWRSSTVAGYYIGADVVLFDTPEYLEALRPIYRPLFRLDQSITGDSIFFDEEFINKDDGS